MGAYSNEATKNRRRLTLVSFIVLEQVTPLSRKRKAARSEGAHLSQRAARFTSTARWDSAPYLHGSWGGPLWPLTCIGTMNRFRPRPRRGALARLLRPRPRALLTSDYQDEPLIERARAQMRAARWDLQFPACKSLEGVEVFCLGFGHHLGRQCRRRGCF